MNKKVFIGVGHGGRDSGAVGNGFLEKNLNLDVARACRDVLRANGVDAVLSRETDTSENLSERIKECLAFNPDLAVDIHHNAGGGDGAEIYHSAGKAYDDALARNILDEIVKIGQNSRGLKTKLYGSTDYFGFVRQIPCPSVLVECAFIDSEDVRIVDTLSERRAMGEAVAKGILKTLGMKTETAGFFPARGYFKKGDLSENVGRTALFMRRVFPSYTSEKALGNYYGDNIVKSITEFQRRTKLTPDGYLGPLTLEMLKKYGFKI